MTKNALTLAALILASGTFAGAAEAGGVRLQFGGPLGSFTAHPTLSSGPGGTMKNSGYAHKPSYDKPHYGKPAYVGRMNHDETPARKVVKHAPPKVDVAEDAPRRVVKKAPKVEVAEEAPVVRKIRKPKIEAPVVKVAKADDKPASVDGAPAIFVPDSPPVAEEGFTGTQSTPAAVRTAASGTVTKAEAGVEPETKTEVVVLPVVEDQPKAEVAQVSDAPAKVADTKPVEDSKPAKASKAEKVSAIAERVCRRFSAAVAGLVEVPCE